ncbi:Hypothetical Protein FCC1311_013362 [Hondaea fermentalgiana]|uniref:Uncharacterized protein n=1 Tax=Hondaea fermentalgiana TaxID=2315210 RepID=A0A2R5G5R7_9STRA|nr:Hypothetical Protein FCC1311_013362 [Hondaea fermentalgiana]|eukprot:GBG25118.1 Hypothetical Protein FCC1311_013362 [Hondaea fermentalgiana]
MGWEQSKGSKGDSLARQLVVYEYCEYGEWLEIAKGVTFCGILGDQMPYNTFLSEAGAVTQGEKDLEDHNRIRKYYEIQAGCSISVKVGARMSISPLCLGEWNTFHGKQAILMIPFGLAGLSFVLWVLIKFGMSVVAADDDYCWGTLPKEFRNHWVPGRDLLRTSKLEEEIWYEPGKGFEGLQGITIDDSFSKLYTFHMHGVRVFGLEPENGTISSVDNVHLYNMSRDFGTIIDRPFFHIGGVEWASSEEYGEEIWLATHAEEMNTEGALIAVDANTLQPKPDRVAARSKGEGWDWITYHPGTHRLYYGYFFNVTTVYWVDIVDLDNDSGSFSIDFNASDPYREGGLQYIQSATIIPETNTLLLFSDDVSNTMSHISLATGTALRHEPLFAGNEADGITYHAGRSTLIAGYNRQHSHEGKIFVSILEYHLVP